jgi:hypothetical protein
MLEHVLVMLYTREKYEMVAVECLPQTPVYADYHIQSQLVLIYAPPFSADIRVAVRALPFYSSPLPGFVRIKQLRSSCVASAAHTGETGGR